MTSPQTAEPSSLQEIIEDYCSANIPKIDELKAALTQASEEQIFNILHKQRRMVYISPLHAAAYFNHPEITTVLLTSVRSAVRLKLLLMRPSYTPLTSAVQWGRIEPAKAILNCLTPEQRLELVTLQWDGKTLVKVAEDKKRQDIVEMLRECLHEQTQRPNGDEMGESAYLEDTNYTLIWSGIVFEFVPAENRNLGFFQILRC